MIYDVIIIGGGAAGLYAAASFPVSVQGLILDRNPKPGRKLLLTGAGQCNLTHGGEIKDFLSHSHLFDFILDINIRIWHW